MKIRKISLETTVKGDRDLFWESEVQVLFLQINTFNNSIPILFQLFICLTFFYVYLFIWLQWVIVVAYELLAEACGIQFPDQALNLGPLHREHGVLATELPGKSLSYVINSIYSEKISIIPSRSIRVVPNHRLIENKLVVRCRERRVEWQGRERGLRSTYNSV